MFKKNLITNLGALTTMLAITAVMKLTAFIAFPIHIITACVLVILFIIYAILTLKYMHKQPYYNLLFLIIGIILVAITLNICLQKLGLQLTNYQFLLPIALIYIMLVFIMLISLLVSKKPRLKVLFVILSLLVILTTTIGFIVLNAEDPQGDYFLGLYFTSFLYYYLFRYLKPRSNIPVISAMAFSMLFFVGIAIIICLIVISEGESIGDLIGDSIGEVFSNNSTRKKRN